MRGRRGRRAAALGQSDRDDPAARRPARRASPASARARPPAPCRARRADRVRRGAGCAPPSPSSPSGSPRCTHAGKVHRDIKPSNILVDATAARGPARLRPGRRRRAARPHRPRATSSGTAAYMAPEQALSARRLARRPTGTASASCCSRRSPAAAARPGRPPTRSSSTSSRPPAAPPRAARPRPCRPTSTRCAARCCSATRRPPDARATSSTGSASTDRRARRSAALARATSRHACARPSSAAPTSSPRCAPPTTRVRDGPLICLVEGVSGVGKSQLVERFLDRARRATSPTTVVLTGRCYEREVVPYKALDGIADALARYLGRLPPVARGRADAPARRPCSRACSRCSRVEAIAAAPADARRSGSARAAPAHVRRAARAVRRASPSAAAWSGTSTICSGPTPTAWSCSQDLLAHEHRLPVFLVATVRPVDDAPRTALLARVRELAPSSGCVLRELPPAEARELAGLLLPGRDAGHARPGRRPTPAATRCCLHELARHADTAREPRHRRTSPRRDARRRASPGSTSHARTLLRGHGGRRRPAHPGRRGPRRRAVERRPGQGRRRAARRPPGPHRRRAAQPTASSSTTTGSASTSTAHSTPRTPARPRTTRLALALEQTGAAEHDPRALVRHARAAGRHALAANYARDRGPPRGVDALAFDQAAEFFATAIELGEPRRREPARACASSWRRR